MMLDDDDHDYDTMTIIYDDGHSELLEDEDTTMPFSYLFQYCITPSLHDASFHIGRLFVCCAIFRIVAQYCDIPSEWKHVISSALGLYVIYYYFKEWAIHMILMVIVFYILILVIQKSRGMLILLLTFVFLVANELIVQNESWQKIRGAEMLLGMKLVSVAFDSEPTKESGRSSRPYKRIHVPGFLQFTGYMFCAATCIFGPWISYMEYLNLFNRNELNTKSLSKIFWSFIFSLIFFLMSICLVEWIIPDNSPSWLLVYRDALLFRCGHYFVSFLSDTTYGLAGSSSSESVCQPVYIEFPRSLNQVVIHWNVSMHKWLKYYVFRTSLQFGGFVSVLVTYIVSALMHGLNYRLAGVLISLGFYTYTEYSIRLKLATKLNSCIAARACPLPCPTHSNTENMLFVKLFNIFFSLLAVFHLAYLGVIIDTTNSEPVSFRDAFEKWQNLNFISHWVALFTFILYLIIY